jgi:hypothetical protein
MIRKIKAFKFLVIISAVTLLVLRGEANCRDGMKGEV